MQPVAGVLSGFVHFCGENKSTAGERVSVDTHWAVCTFKAGCGRILYNTVQDMSGTNNSTLFFIHLFIDE